jgi:putative ABC transport system permease protein
VSARRPPWLATRLLEALLPEESREAVIGDLVEAYEVAAASNRIAAYLRFWRESFAAIVELQVTPDSVTAFTPYAPESAVQSFVSDLRRAVRLLARTRGFTALCVATLGVAIGATTAIFSVVNPVLFRPLPYPDAGRIVTIWERERDGSPSNVGYPTYQDLMRAATTLKYGAVVDDWAPTLFGRDDAERMSGMRASWQYFRVLGVRPALGRDFEAQDDTPDNSNVVILGYGLWQRRFAGDSAIIGQKINVSGISRIVIGVMPASFEHVLDPTAQIWRPLGYATQPYACRTCRHLRFIGRLRDGATEGDATRELDGLARQIAAAYPKDYATVGALTIGLQDLITRDSRPVLLAILGAVALLLLIAAANVTNLQLARAVRREEEFAVRVALGAGRGRLAQQLLAEGLIIALLGATVGTGIAYASLPALIARLPDSLPRLSAVRVDPQALALVAALTLVIGVVVGLAPALHGGRIRLFDALRGSTRTLGAANHRARMSLVVGEIALALMLVIGATLVARSLVRLLAVDAGFNASHLLTIEVAATGTAYPTAASVFANHDRIREAVRRVPGVLAVGLTSQLPLAGSVDRYGIAAKDKPLDNPELAPSADRYTVSADFIRMMRIPLLRGRDFTEAEASDSNAQIAIVSDALAKRIWPGEDAVGKWIRLGGETRPWKQVIGIVGNVRHTGLDATVTQQVYIPERQWYNAESLINLVVRTRTDPAAMGPAIREAVRSVDASQPIYWVVTMDDMIRRSTAQRRLGLLLFTLFGVVALLLASAGIYGVLAGSVAERTREFGLRTALGATPQSIVAIVLHQGARLAVVGLLIGGVGAFALSRYLRSLLFGVQATDPVAVGLAVATIVAVSMFACLVPAMRAVRVDPMMALRAD